MDRSKTRITTKHMLLAAPEKVHAQGAKMFAIHPVERRTVYVACMVS